MADVGKFRNEDLSMWCWLKNLVGSKVEKVVDAYPYTQIEENTLEVPCVSIQHRQTAEEGGELGSSWFRRMWVIDVFAISDTQRDELSDIIFQGLDGTISIKDFSEGFVISGNDCKKNIIGTDLGEIERIQPRDRIMRPIYSFGDHSKIKFWRMNIIYSTISTQINVVS